MKTLEYFDYDHLPLYLRPTSAWFYSLAHKIAGLDGNKDEIEVALRKLLEAKDATIRSIVKRGE